MQILNLGNIGRLKKMQDTPRCSLLSDVKVTNEK